MLHVLPAARTVPTQPVPLLITENTLVGEPVVVAVAAPTRKATVPEFRTDTVDVVVVPRFTVPNLTGLGDSVTASPNPCRSARPPWSHRPRCAGWSTSPCANRR